MQNRSLDHNISKRSRSPTLSYQDADVTEAHTNTGGNSRRYLKMFVSSGVILYILCIVSLLYEVFKHLVL